MTKSKLLSNIAIGYVMFGFVFAIAFAIYYHWTPLAFLSPGFYFVILTWPYQAIGFVQDLFIYGFTGKPI